MTDWPTFIENAISDLLNYLDDIVRNLDKIRQLLEQEAER